MVLNKSLTWRNATTVFPLVSCLFLFSCSVTNYVVPAYDKIEIIANKDVNPDGEERPSPIQIKVYELSSRSTFDNLDFDKMFYQGSTFLSDQLLSEAVYILQPSETVEHEIKLSETAGFIAILAAYRDIDSARWKHIYEVKPSGYYNHEITLTEKGIVSGKQSGGAVSTEDIEKSVDTAEKTKSTAQKFHKKR